MAIMSWTMDEGPIREFEFRADQNLEGAHSFELDIWDQTPGNPNGAWIRGLKDTTYLETAPTCLRIIFAPLDIPHINTKKHMVRLFRAIGVPTAFVAERLLSVSYSFGNISGPGGYCAWFHFLCKRIDVDTADAPGERGLRIVHHQSASHVPNGQRRTRALPQADYAYDRSGFFLHTTHTGIVTLCCFGAARSVRSRLERLLKAGDWKLVLDEPHILLDVVLEGLHLQVDQNVWNMNVVFGAAEHRLLLSSSSAGDKPFILDDTFAELHNLAKHITHLREALESCLLLLNEMASSLDRLPLRPPSFDETTRKQTQDSIRYRKTLFQSTLLRLNSLDHRVANSIALSFNLLTASDSVLLIQHSNFMKIMAAITMIFLPTTAVAAIFGSQLFYSEPEAEGWVVKTSPLLRDMWAVAIPLTFTVIACAVVWDFRTRHRPAGRRPDDRKG